MRVLLVTQQFAKVRSGVGTYARVLAGGLADRGLDVTVATWKEEVDRRRFGRLLWMDLDARPRRDPTPGAFWSLGRAAVEAIHATTTRYDVVHFLDAREAWACHGRRRPRGSRLIGTVHDDYALRAPRAPWGYRGRCSDPFRRWLYHQWLQRIERRTYHRLDLLLANAVPTMHMLVRGYDLPYQKVRVHPLAVPLAMPQLARVEMRGDPVLLFVGGNFFRKGLDQVVRAIPEIRINLPGVVLHVAGEDRARARIERLARAVGASDALVFHGRVEPPLVATMMSLADQLVVPARHEALGLVFLEAFNLALPAIAGSVGGVTDIVRNGHSGLTVPPEDPEAISQAVIELHRDRALRQRVIEGGREVLAERTVPRLVDDALLAYGAMRHSHRRPARPLVAR
jgi:glycosyltransferase involved in cell wall biosynthesis